MPWLECVLSKPCVGSNPKCGSVGDGMGTKGGGEVLLDGLTTNVLTPESLSFYSRVPPPLFSEGRRALGSQQQQLLKPGPPNLERQHISAHYKSWWYSVFGT